MCLLCRPHWILSSVTEKTVCACSPTVSPLARLHKYQVSVQTEIWTYDRSTTVFFLPVFSFISTFGHVLPLPRRSSKACMGPSFLSSPWGVEDASLKWDRVGTSWDNSFTKGKRRWEWGQQINPRSFLSPTPGEVLSQVNTCKLLRDRHGSSHLGKGISQHRKAACLPLCRFSSSSASHHPGLASFKQLWAP